MAETATMIRATRLGQIKGVLGGGCAVFLGAPYAKPPVGALRWKPPAPHDGWQGVFDATEYPKRSFQLPFPSTLNRGEVPGEMSEDMLYLNIYTPDSAQPGSSLPVLLYIHGGGYTVGSANDFDPSPFARKHNAVVVSINYRLGIFGFLDLSQFGDDYAGSASLGFQDQIAALKWVRDNIADYGGDPDNITVTGVSAGAGSVLALMSAPAAKGLFHKAVSFSPGEIARAPADMVATLGAATGLGPKELFEQLKSASAEHLFKMQVESSWTGGGAVDGKIVVASPDEAIRAKVNNVPLIVGTCVAEGTMLTPSVEEYDLNGLEQILLNIAVTIGAGDSARYLRFLDELLPGASARDRMTRLWYDYFRAPTLRSAEAMAEAGGQAWVYSFEAPTDHEFGPTHASCMPFSFNLFEWDHIGEGDVVAFHRSTAANRRLAAQWSNTIAHFMRTGNPNWSGIPLWPTYDRETRCSLALRETPVVVERMDPPGALSAYGLA